MTTIAHEAVVELFRFDGELVKKMFGRHSGMKGLEPEVVSAELTQLPSQYRADSVIVFKGKAQRRPRFAVVIEVQTTAQSFKKKSWPIYVCATRATYRCPTLLLVVAINDKIARWARASIETGHPGFTLKPLVIDREQIPEIGDPDSARRSPQLAVLSALAHPSLEAAVAALAVLDRVSPEYVDVYRDLIVSKLSKPEQRFLEGKMQFHQWQSESAKKQIAAFKREARRTGKAEGRKIGRALGRKEGHREGREEGHREGREEGHREGREEGREEGRILAQQDAAIRLAEDKLGALSARETNHIRALRDEKKLLALIVRLSRATTKLQARAELRAR